MRAILIEKPDAAPLVAHLEVQEEGAANSFSSPDPPFEMPDVPNFEEAHQVSSADFHRQSADSQLNPVRVLTLLLQAPKDRPKCTSEYEAVGLVGLVGLPPFNLMLGTSLRANPLCHIVMQYSRYPELLELFDANGHLPLCSTSL